MAQIVQAGSINTAALVVPDLYVVNVLPQNLVINGVATDKLGYCGTASWGPVGSPVVVGSGQYASLFGPVMARKFDMGTHVAVAGQQGAQNFRCVRATDTTDVAATATVAAGGSAGITLSGLYTGSLLNNGTVTLSTGSKVGTVAVTIMCPGLATEKFDNIAGSGAALWVAIAAAINSGIGTTRGQSNIATAVVGVSVAPPALNTPTAFAGGTDGATGVTAAMLVGSDVTPRRGMYALRGTGCSIGVVCDADDATQWAAQVAFGQSEGVYMMLVSAAGSAITNGTTGTIDLRASAGIDSTAAKICHGDWVWWSDATNGYIRLVSPQSFYAGRLANLSPQFSALNQPMNGIVGTQRTGLPGAGTFGLFSNAELATDFTGGADIITNPSPGGFFWSARNGGNSSSNPNVNGDNYTRMTNFLDASVAAVFGQFVGQPITPTLLQRVSTALMTFFGTLSALGMIGNSDGTIPYGVICDQTNNPFARTSLGYVTADCQVVYLSITRFLILNIQGGQTVLVSRSVGQSGSVIN